MFVSKMSQIVVIPRQLLRTIIALNIFLRNALHLSVLPMRATIVTVHVPLLSLSDRAVDTIGFAFKGALVGLDMSTIGGISMQMCVKWEAQRT